MKKVLVAAILGLAAVTSVKAQGSVILYNYNTGKLINYGQNSGGTVGQPVTGGYSVAFYFVAGDQTATINSAFSADANANGNLATLAPTLSLYTGANGIATIGTDAAGYFSNVSASANVGAAGTYTFVIVAYNGTSYANSTGVGQARGHSQAFTFSAVASPSTPGTLGSGSWTSFAVSAVPEPSTFALAGLGLAGLLIFRRRN